jgi:arylformamidase
MKVHKILLDRDVLLLEGLRLGEIKEGVYTLFAAPINLGEAEGAPCRAVLIE